MTWFVLALLSTFFFIFYSLLSRVLCIKSENPRAFSVVYNSFCSLIVLSFWFFEGQSFKPINSSILLLTFLATVIWGIFNRVEFYAVKNMEASLLIIVMKIAHLTTFFAATLLLNEVMTVKKILAAALILGGSVFVLYKGDKKIKDKGLIYALITAISLGFGWTIDKKVSVFYPTSLYVLIGYSIPTFYVWAIPPLPFEAIKKEFRQASWKVILLALINVLGYYTMVKAFAFGEASRITLITSTTSIFVVLAGIIALKERTNIIKKILAGIIVSSGILLLK